MTFIEQAHAAKGAARALATASRAGKDAALNAMAEELLAAQAAERALHDQVRRASGVEGVLPGRTCSCSASVSTWRRGQRHEHHSGLRARLG